MAGRHRDIAAVVLAVVSGSIDAIGFIALGGAFTSVMTGNMVLLGIGAAEQDGELAGHALAAIAAFVVGCAVGARLAGSARADDERWPPSITRALAVEALILVAAAAGWWSADSRPHGGVQLFLLIGNAVALGLQSSAVQRFGVSGLSTTYMTGTLTTVVMNLAAGRPLREVAHRGSLLVGLILGAATGALLALHIPAAAPLLPMLGIAVVLLAALHAGRHVHAERARRVSALRSGSFDDAGGLA